MTHAEVREYSSLRCSSDEPEVRQLRLLDLERALALHCKLVLQRAELSTTSSSQVNDSICGPSNLKNVVDGGDLSGTTLAATCTWRTTGQIVNADIRIDTSSRSWYTGSSTAGCSGSSTYDLKGVMTHEAGHFFGLNHVAQSTNQVMVPSSFACQTSHRRLGNGDLAGMKARYP